MAPTALDTCKSSLQSAAVCPLLLSQAPPSLAFPHSVLRVLTHQGNISSLIPPKTVELPPVAFSGRWGISFLIWSITISLIIFSYPTRTPDDSDISARFRAGFDIPESKAYLFNDLFKR